MVKYTYKGKEFIISDNAESKFQETMGWSLKSDDLYVYIYAAFNTKRKKNPKATLEDITNEDIEKSMYSELRLYASYTE